MAHAQNVTRAPTTTRHETVPPWLALVGFVLLAQLAGIVGLPFTDTGPGSWYDQLDKPGFTPPGWVFGPAWTTLYLLIGVAAWRIWRTEPGSDRTVALSVWAGQLALNALWTPLFFGAELPWLALVDIAALVVAILVCTALFVRIDRWAGLLMLPYLAWVSFATVLNATIAAAN
jgi:translocator protein